jgi:hypothetical protein
MPLYDFTVFREPSALVHVAMQAARQGRDRECLEALVAVEREEWDAANGSLVRDMERFFNGQGAPSAGSAAPTLNYIRTSAQPVSLLALITAQQEHVPL